MTSASTGRFSDYNKLWHYHWISLVQPALPGFGWIEVRPVEGPLSTLRLAALSANNNLSDKALTGESETASAMLFV
jgi:hypothetical protein